jgi:hypothetical protein
MFIVVPFLRTEDRLLAEQAMEDQTESSSILSQVPTFVLGTAGAVAFAQTGD